MTETVAQERVPTRIVAQMTGFSARKVQMLAERGRIPSAARLAGGCWTFDPIRIRAWIKRGETEVCRTTSIGEGKSGTDDSRFEVKNIDRAYERLLKQKRR